MQISCIVSDFIPLNLHFYFPTRQSFLQWTFFTVFTSSSGRPANASERPWRQQSRNLHRTNPGDAQTSGESAESPPGERVADLSRVDDVTRRIWTVLCSDLNCGAAGWTWAQRDHSSPPESNNSRLCFSARGLALWTWGPAASFYLRLIFFIKQSSLFITFGCFI